jgi:hypothetical protein
MRIARPVVAALILLGAGCTLTNDPADIEPPPDTAGPAAPTGLVAIAGNGQVALTWNANSDWDLARYAVLLGTESGVYSTAGETTTPQFVVGSLVNETPYFFTVVAIDKFGNLSEMAAEASSTPDGTPPTVAAFSPLDGATNENLSVNLVLTFSEPMVRSTVESAVTLGCSPSCAAPACVWSWAAGDTVAICDTANDFDFGQTLTVTVGTGATDIVGNAMASAAVASFSTLAAPDTTRPTVVSTTPPQSSTGRYPETDISVTFSEAMDQSSTVTAFQLLTVGGADAAPYRGGSFDWPGDGRTLVYNPPVDLPNGAVVTYSVGTGAKDKAAVPNYLLATYNGSFQVARRTTNTLWSEAAIDGYGYMSSTQTNPGLNTVAEAIYVGDGVNNYQWKGLVSFNHASLSFAPSRIRSAVFWIYQAGCSGLPYEYLDTVSPLCLPKLGNDCDADLLARQVAVGTSWSTAELQTLTYIASAGEITEVATAEWKSKTVTSLVEADRVAARGRTQFRLEFPVTTNNDSIADYCTFYSGEYAANTALRPNLVVDYEYP